jgi:hypothetical protein
MPMMFTLYVQYSEVNHARGLNVVEYFIRKSARQNSAKFLVIEWPPFGVCFQPFNGSANFLCKFAAESRTLGFIGKTVCSFSSGDTTEKRDTRRLEKRDLSAPPRFP